MTSRTKIPFFYRAKIRDVLNQFQAQTGDRYSETLFAPLHEREPDVHALETLILALSPRDLAFLNTLSPSSGTFHGQWKRDALISVCASDPLLHVVPFVTALLAAKLDFPADLAAKLLIEHSNITPHVFARALDRAIANANVAPDLESILITLASRGIAAPKHEIFLSRLKPHIARFETAVNTMARRSDPNPKPAFLLCALGRDPAPDMLGWLSKNLADRNRPEAALLNPSNHARRLRMRLITNPGPDQIVQWQLRDLRRFFSPADQEGASHG